MESLKCSAYPRTVFLEILYGCNLYCGYCYIGRERNHTSPIVPPLETTVSILNILRHENVEEIVLLGGEPMLHPRFTDICSTIARLDFQYRGVVTNGTAMTLDKAKLLGETGFWVDISFRGPDASTFDAVAGKEGAFQKALDAALMLSRLGIPVGIEIDCIPRNHDRLYETIKMLIDIGASVKQLQLHRVLPEGDAEGNMERFFLSLAQWQTVFDQALRIRDELDIPVAFEDGFPFCLVKPEHWDFITPCACGFTLLTISPGGDARHCSCQTETLGNILQAPLSVIWKQRLQDYRAPTRHYPACLECDLLEACRGGCSASNPIYSDEGVDVFHEHFRPVRLDGGFRPETKLILGQSIRVSDDARARKE